ncbi:MAG: Ethanolamine utilization protein EutD [Ignavibacteria bacterium]|nr:Ethanolamine utilization protein EutD [Ignavibacteria bacterium]
MNLFKSLEASARRKIKTIIYPESYDKRIIDAVKFILKKKIAQVILIDKNYKLDKTFAPDKNLTILDLKFSDQFVGEYHSIKLKRDPSRSLIKSKKEISDPLVFSCMLLKKDFADGIIAGSVYPTSDVLRNSISVLGLEKNCKSVSSFFLFTFPSKSIHNNKVLAFADCGVIPSPDAEQLSDIAVQTALNFKKLTGLKPRVAFLSYSTKGSAKDASFEKIFKAVTLSKKKMPSLICEGELQFDAAFVPNVASRKNPNGIIKGDANIFIFPDLNSGNIAYKITERIGMASATGPILQGLSKKVMDLSRGCSVEDIINMTTVISNLI